MSSRSRAAFPGPMGIMRGSPSDFQAQPGHMEVER